jgi:uncharacterized protein (DUF2267 family)
MNDIINLVAQKAGISPDQARTAVETVVAFMKDKLPGPLAGQVEGLLAGSGDGASLGDAIKNLRGAMGS